MNRTQNKTTTQPYNKKTYKNKNIQTKQHHKHNKNK